MTRLRLNDADVHRRILITGIGIVSTVGRTVAGLWESLTSLDDPESIDRNVAPRHNGMQQGVADFTGRIDDFCELPAVTRKAIQKSLKLMNRETQMGVAAGQQALQDSGLLQNYDPERIGVCFGAENFPVMPEDFQAGVQACSDDSGNLIRSLGAGWDSGSRPVVAAEMSSEHARVSSGDPQRSARAGKHNHST